VPSFCDVSLTVPTFGASLWLCTSFSDSPKDFQPWNFLREAELPLSAYSVLVTARRANSPPSAEAELVFGPVLEVVKAYADLYASVIGLAVWVRNRRTRTRKGKGRHEGEKK